MRGCHSQVILHRKTVPHPEEPLFCLFRYCEAPSYGAVGVPILPGMLLGAAYRVNKEPPFHGVLIAFFFILPDGCKFVELTLKLLFLFCFLF